MTAHNTLWTSFGIVLLGLWQIATSFTYSMLDPVMMPIDLISGACLIVFGFLSRKKRSYGAPWIVALIGILLQLAPLIFWIKDPATYFNDTLIGVLAIAFSIVIPPSSRPLHPERQTIPPGWSYNPSSWPQRIPIAFVAFLCWMISRYLCAFQLEFIPAVWDPFFHQGTETVLTSKISRSFPVSDAGLGAFAYTLEFLFTCQGDQARWRTAPWLVLIFGILVVPVSLVSIALIILQPLAVGAWCTLCLATALLMLFGIPFALDEVIASIQYLRSSKKASSLLFRGGTCPKAKDGPQAPTLDKSLIAIFKESLKGITFPWNLALSFFLGILLMIVPSLGLSQGVLNDLDPLFGALIATIAVMSFSVVARSLRWVNLLLAALLFAAACYFSKGVLLPFIVLHCGFAAAFALLAFHLTNLRKLLNFSFKSKRKRLN